jgi:transcriptional regulator with XRE-family HTH domain
MPRSLRVHEHHLIGVKSALLRNGFPNQRLLAEALQLSQSTVSNFLNGKPVDFVNFTEICRTLGKEWRDLADLGDAVHPISAEPARRSIFLRNLGGENTASQASHLLQHALRLSGHDVLLGTNATAPGIHLPQVDYWLLLLCPRTIGSEILLEEFRCAQDLYQTTPQKPAIFPLWLQTSQTTQTVTSPGSSTGSPNRVGSSNSLSLFDAYANELLQSLREMQFWCWNGNVASLVAELLPLLKEGRTALPPHHPWAASWERIGQLYGTIAGFLHRSASEETADRPTLNLNSVPELPEGQLILDSPFYMPRPPVEQRCFETIHQEGSLIRIKAPRQMGKSSLLVRILHQAQQQGSRVLHLNLQLANKRVFTDSDRFLQWFCASLGLELGQLDHLENCWQLAPLIGSNQCCKAFLEQYILADPAPSLTLGLDEVDRVFESPEIADDFFGLLRALHEAAKQQAIWKKLRLVVVHSTEVYISLDVNKSPFNVGLAIELPEFTAAQVQALAQEHGLDWNETSIATLLDWVGGHPYLIRLALYAIAAGSVTLPKILQGGHLETGIYADHLRRHWWNLEQHPPLLAAMQTVVRSPEPVGLRSSQAFKLNSMGLIHLRGNLCQVRCRLYQRYFGDCFAQLA